MPLNVTSADALATVGRSIKVLGRTSTPYIDTFAGLRIDRSKGQVIVYTTDVASGKRLAAEGASRLPARLSASVPLVVERSKYSRLMMEAAARTVWSSAAGWQASGVEVYTISLRSDGSGLTVGTSDPVAANRLAATDSDLHATTVAASDISFVKGHPVHSVSRADDTPPYFGGAPIRWDWEFLGYNCTSAWGVRDAGGAEYLVTAEHCFDVGDGVEDGGGDQVGEVVRENDLYDAALIRTNTSGGVWLNDTLTYTFSTSDWSLDGEQVCQSGYTLNMRCSIIVTDESIQWRDDTGKVRSGVQGHQCEGCSAVSHGDSGGPVWVLYTNDVLESRGVVSAGSVETDEGGYEYIYWTETPTILSAFGVELLTTYA
jgi:hypothetical protein